MATCEICGKEFKRLGHHIIRTHNISIKEYYDKYLKSNESEGVCPCCGKPTSFIGFNGYFKHCSVHCAQIDPVVQDKMKYTWIDHYGVDNPWKSEEVKNKIKETTIDRYGVSSVLKLDCVHKLGISKAQSLDATIKRKQTCFEKYGAESPFQAEEIQYKIHQTIKDRYGVDNISQSKKIKQKKIETCLERYGVEYSISSKEVREKSKLTILEKYGVEHPMYSDEIKDRLKYTNLEKYGVEYSLQAEEVKEKKKQTCLEKYGVECSLQSEEIKDKSRQTCLEKYGVENSSQSELVKDKMRQTCLDRYGVDHPWKSEEVRKKIHESKLKNHSYGISMPEERTFEKLIEIFNNVEREHREDRYPYFCDFYIPERDMFIEYNGFWTHNTHWYDENSEEDKNKVKLWESKDSNYHRAAIHNWTISDKNKRETARKNNLNYVVFWNENDVDKWIADGCPDRQDWR